MASKQPSSAANRASDSGTPSRVRLDRWLWAARFFKTRAQAKAAIEGGKVQVDGARPKVAKDIAPGAEVRVRKAGFEQVVKVTGLASQRGSAAIAATLYEETPDSIETRERDRALRQMQREGLRVPDQRPTRQGRRALQDLKRDGAASE